MSCCDEWWHTLLTSPPQSYTAEQVREHFTKKALDTKAEKE